MSWGEDGGVGGGEAFRAVPLRGVRVPWIDRWVLTAVHGTPGVDGAPRRAAGEWGALTGAVSPLEGQWTPVAVQHPPHL